jgi:hypothetical protein
MKWLAFLSLWLVLFTTSSLSRVQITSQSQDPLHDSLNFLKRKLQTHLTYSLRAEDSPEVGSSRFESLNFETCRIAWRISTETGQSPEIPAALSAVKISNHVSVNLSSIDAARTRIYVVEEMRRRNIPRSLVLELRIRPGSPGFKLQMVTTKDGRVTRIPTLEPKEYSFFFDIKDRRVVEEVSKAFAEASNICRARIHRP